MVILTARSGALAGGIAVAALFGALTCRPAQADYYAFGNTLTPGYAVLDLDVNSTWFPLTTQGVQGWISTGQYGVGGAYGANTSYTAGLYNAVYSTIILASICLDRYAKCRLLPIALRYRRPPPSRRRI